jgi:hypothetical protein
VAVVAVAVVAGALAACTGPDGGHVTITEVLAASVTGREATRVTVRFDVPGHAECGGYEGTDVQETAAAVTVGVRVRRFDRDCPDDARQLERAVTLRDPLGDRTVVDASTGQHVPVTVAP